MALQHNILLESGTNEFEIVEFVINGIRPYHFCINVAKVREVIVSPEVVQVPDAHHTIIGTANIRQSLVPIINLGQWLNIKGPCTDEELKSSKVIVTYFNGAANGFLVDDVIRIHRITWADIRDYSSMTDMQLVDTVLGVVCEDGETIMGDKVIVSTGGKSFPHTGSDGMMFDILKKYNHTITNFYPALTPLTVKENWIKNLQGISVQNVEISAKIKKKKISIIGDMLFAHFGLTGPGVLKFSSHINKYIHENELELNIDFTPNVSADEISKIIRENPNKNVINNLNGLLPQNFLKEIFNLLDLTDKTANELSKTDETKIIEYIKSMKLTCNGSRGIKTGQVTSGGVSVKEINSSTLESKLINNLYFTGEVIDVDAETGGYNLQIAFSTGYLAGISI